MCEYLARQYINKPGTIGERSFVCELWKQGNKHGKATSKCNSPIWAIGEAIAISQTHLLL